MKKYVEVNQLLELFRDDEMLSCDRPFDVYQWAANIIEECPAAEVVEAGAYLAGAVGVDMPDGTHKAVCFPLSMGQSVWTPEGRHGAVETLYVGKRGVQRIFIRFDDGESINLKPKGIGKDIVTEQPF